ncbi:MAG: hypothetical protein E7230_07045 [Clostridiales bacterium]|nr:hypothetical protein [Clostridiales bacterium]
MKKRFIAFILIGILALAFAGCGSSGSESTDNDSSLPEVTSPEDALIVHDVYHTASGEDWDEYSIVFYGNDTETLKGLTIQTKFDKNAGYTVEYLESLDLDEVYPGFSKMSFANSYVIDNGDTIDVIVRFMELDNLDNINAVCDSGVLIREDPNSDSLISARSLMDNFEEEGMEYVPLTDYEGLNLDFNVE